MKRSKQSPRAQAKISFAATSWTPRFVFLSKLHSPVRQRKPLAPLVLCRRPSRSTRKLVAMRAKTARVLFALVLCECGTVVSLSPPLSARATTGEVTTLIAPSRRVSQRQKTGTCRALASARNHGRFGDQPGRVSPLRLFGLGGGDISSTSRGASAGGASKARRAVEANPVFKSRMAKVLSV